MYHNPFSWGWHPLAYCVPPYFYLVYCVPPCFGLAYCVSFNNKTTIFGNFIYIKKVKWQYVACICTIILANVNLCVFACYIFDFRYPQINVYVNKCSKWPPKGASVVFFTWYVTFAVVLNENWNFLINRLNL